MEMKVLMALMALETGGAETHVIELAKTLKKRGLKVFVVSNGGRYEDHFRQDNIPHFKAPLHNKNPMNIIKSYKILKDIIISNDINIVHAHARIPAFVCGILKNTLNFRFVTTAHWVFNANFPFNILTNWGDHTLAVSEDIKEYMINKYNMDPRDITLTVNGIDMNTFSKNSNYNLVMQELNISEDKINIVHVSRLDSDRSYVANKLLNIADELYKIYRDIQIIIVGDGTDSLQMISKAHQINKSLGTDVIIMTGARMDINRFLNMAKLFIGVSRAALEAMSVGVPCIISGNEGHIGIFDESKAKIAVDTNFCARGLSVVDEYSLLSDIRALLDNDNDSSLVSYGQDFVKHNYSLDLMATQTIKVYKDLIKNKAKKVNIMISGYYGYENNGDDLLLKSIIGDFRMRATDVHIVVLSMSPKSTRATYGVDSINRSNFFKINRLLKKTNLLISGGGGLIQDVTSTRSLLYYLHVILLAKLYGVKVMLYANGIGPIRKATNKLVTSEIINRVDLITVRDKSSLNELTQLKITKPLIYLTADAAFSSSIKLDLSEKELILKKYMLKEHKYFCIAIRDFYNLADGFHAELAKALDYVVDKYDLMPVFLLMQPHNDAHIAKLVMSIMNHKSLMLAEEEYLKDNVVVTLIAYSRFVLAMRLHSVIYAARTCSPVIGIIYDKKVKNMFEYLKSDSYVYVEKFSYKELIKHIDLKMSSPVYDIDKSINDLLTYNANKNIDYALELLFKEKL